MRFLYSFLTLLLFSSCIEEMKGLPDTPEQLVLECYISPSDTVVQAVLSRATSFTEKEIKYTDLFVKDATITISDGIVEKQLHIDTTNHFYQLKISEDLKIKKGKSYWIRAVAQNGEVLTATCTVPLTSIPAEQITIEKLPRTNNMIDIRISWKHDPADQYIVRPYYFPSSPKFINRPTAHSPQFISCADISTEKLTTNYFTNNLAYSTRKNAVFVYVVDEHFYAYSKSTYSNENNQDDPYAQRLNAKSNVTGGLGCFGAYNVTRLDIEF
jgi:hypothetical protein